MQTASIIANRDTDGPELLTARSPATGEALASLRPLDAAGAGAAVAAASAAFPGYSRTPFAERQRWLARWLAIMVDEREELARLVARENGKPVAEVLLVDVFPACDALAYLARHAHRLLGFEPVRPRQVLFAHWRAGYRFDPLGVVAVIAPWNYPVAIPVIEIAAALAAGNTVVFKPASATALTGLAVAEMARRAGFPPGVLNTVVLPGRATDALVDDPRVAKVLFTGSVAIGRRVAQRCAARLAPCQLELGGKDAAVVAADAHLERTARGLVWGAFMNSGQTCASIERVYVEQSIFEPLLQRVVELTQQLKVGDPLAEDTDLGPMTTAEQREEVHRQVSAALAAGARALTGGALPAGSGYFYPPTVLVGVSDDMDVMTEETFGPVLPMVPVASLEEGVRRANASRFGLTASVWTRSRATALRLQRELEAGVVTVNDHVVAFGEVTGSWGGLRESGIGRSHGRYGLLELCNIKYVTWDSGTDRATPWYYPYDQDFGRFIRAGIPALYASGRQKIASLLELASTRRFRTRARLGSVVANADRLFP
ncbi:MAG: aldehyde dehydrogenase family protein [Acidobacteriota bacterium]|jgi:succinate-semialdehyde dehydrogenase/glutarate-semialdehyde dehydrogenase